MSLSLYLFSRVSNHFLFTKEELSAFRLGNDLGVAPDMHRDPTTGILLDESILLCVEALIGEDTTVHDPHPFPLWIGLAGVRLKGHQKFPWLEDTRKWQRQ